MNETTKAILKAHREGNKGYLECFRDLVEKYSQGLMCAEDLDICLIVLRADFEQMKNYGIHKCIWTEL